MKNILAVWKSFLSDRKQLIVFTVSMTFFFLSGNILTNFLDVAQNRGGFSFTDPVLSIFQPVNLTWFTFIVIYGGVFLALWLLLKEPAKFALTAQVFSIVYFARYFSMQLLPLSAPETIIPLTDPMIGLFADGKTFTNDLFFSGHTSSITVFYLAFRDKKIWGPMFAVFSITMPAAILLQHAHYTIDVFIAYFVAIAAHAMVYRMNEKYGILSMEKKS